VSLNRFILIFNFVMWCIFACYVSVFFCFAVLLFKFLKYSFCSCFGHLLCRFYRFTQRHN